MVFETDVGGDLSSSYTTWVSPGMTYTRSLLIHAVEPGDIFGLGGATDAAPADCRCIPVEPVVTAEGNTEWAPPAITGHIAARGFVQFGTGNSSRYEFDGSTASSVPGQRARVTIIDCATSTYADVRVLLSLYVTCEGTSF